MNQIANIFSAYGLAEKELVDIANYFTLKKFKSGELFIKKDMVEDAIGFVKSGIFQFYYEDVSDEITTYIALKNNVIVSVQCFFAGQPSKENIKALVDSELWLIKKSDFEMFKGKISGFNEFYTKVLEHLLICIDESRFDFITLTPDERYAKLMTNEPELIQQVPLKYLSSLIGVTPRHLSRIRKNIR
jgi:CRP-like cAMP-binding protein